MSRRKLIGAIVVGMVRVTVATGAMAQEASARPAIAIADVAVSPGGWTLPPPQLSSAIVDLMTGELVSSQRFHVYDGQWLVPESEVGRANVERLRAVAAERHVDYVVLGNVTAFSTERSQRRGGGILPKPMGLGGFSRDRTQTAVAITFRVVDVHTGEVVSTATGQGMGRRHSTGLGLLGIVRGLPLPLAAAAASRNLGARDAMLDEAVRQAVHTAAIALAQITLPVTRRP
jgi:curli biogenesis system outer membrane secretion channel CsgG